MDDRLLTDMFTKEMLELCCCIKISYKTIQLPLQTEIDLQQSICRSVCLLSICIQAQFLLDCWLLACQITSFFIESFSAVISGSFLPLFKLLVKTPTCFFILQRHLLLLMSNMHANKLSLSRFWLKLFDKSTTTQIGC